MKKKNIFISLICLVLLLGSVAGFSFANNNSQDKVEAKKEVKKTKTVSTPANDGIVTKTRTVKAPANVDLKTVVPSKYKIGTTYEEAMDDDRPAVLIFYADWCGYCKRLAPTLPAIAEAFEDDLNIVMINAGNDENEENVKLGNKYRINGYPSVFVVDPVYDFKYQVSPANVYPVEKFATELETYLSQRK